MDLLYGEKCMSKEFTNVLPGNASNNQYQILFDKNPQPMWVYDLDTLEILAVNDAAVKNYGYSREEFLKLNLKDIRPTEDIPRLKEHLLKDTEAYYTSKNWRHLKKDGTIINVEVESQLLEFNGKNARIVSLKDVTETKKTEEINRYYANIIKSSNDAIIGKDLNGIISSWNEAAELMYGYSSSEMLGKSIGVIFPPEKKHELDYIIEQIKNGRKLYHYETIRLRKDGRKIDVSITVSPIRNINGEIIGASDITRYITKNKKIEAERNLLFRKEKEARRNVEKNKDRLQFLSEASKILVSSLNYENTLTTISKIAVPQICDYCIVYIINEDGILKKIAGTSPNNEKIEVKGKFNDNSSSNQDEKEIFYEILKTGQPKLIADISAESMGKNFSNYAYIEGINKLGINSIIMVPLKSRDRVFGVMVFAQGESNRRFTENDLTFAAEVGDRAGVAIENAKLYIETNKLNDELENRVKERTLQLVNTNKELETFSYSVSHDLRTPLRAIEGFLNIFLDEYGDKLDEEGERLLNIVISNSSKMGNLIDDLLKFSRVSRAGIAKTAINMKQLFESSFEEITGMEKHRNIDFQIEQLPSASGDYSMIHQVAINLLSNAVKFTRPRDVAKIKVGTDKVDGEQTYYVRDNGVGFEMKYVDNLFNVFQRLHKPKDFEGTGVGLALVKRIIDKHGGDIWAESKLDEGTSFYFTLPERSN